MARVIPGPTFPIAPGSKHNTNPAMSGTYIPVIWSGKMLVNFYETSTFTAVANTDFQGEIKNYGDEIMIRSVPKTAVRKYEVGKPLVYDAPNPEVQSLKIDQGHYFAFEASDVLSYQSDIPALDKFTQEAAEAMKLSLDSECWYHVFGEAAAANKGATAGKKSRRYNLGTDTEPVVVTPDNALSLVLQMASVLDEQAVPGTDRFLIIDSHTRHALFQGDLAKVFVTGDATSPIRNGLLGSIDRFKIYVTDLLPRAVDEAWVSGDETDSSIVVPGGAPRRLLIAGHKSALTFASQITKNETLRTERDFADLVRGLHVYGRKCVKPESLVTAVIS